MRTSVRGRPRPVPPVGLGHTLSLPGARATSGPATSAQSTTGGAAPGSGSRGGGRVRGRGPGRRLTSFRPGDDGLRVALRLTPEVDRLTLDHSSVLRGHRELRKSFRKETHWEHDIKRGALLGSPRRRARAAVRPPAGARPHNRTTGPEGRAVQSSSRSRGGRPVGGRLRASAPPGRRLAGRTPVPATGTAWLRAMTRGCCSPRQCHQWLKMSSRHHCVENGVTLLSLGETPGGRGPLLWH